MNSPSSNAPYWPSKPSGTTSRQRSGKNTSQQSSGRQRTAKRIAKGGLSESSGKKHRTRRDEVLRRLDVDPVVLRDQPQIMPLLRQNAVRPEKLAEVLRCDVDPDSLKFVQLWDKLSPASRTLAGVEAIAMSAGMTPRRLWELFCGASLVQSRESVGLMIALSQPDIVRVTIEGAKKVKGIADREHLYKASGFLPTPKGSVTTVNVGQPQPEEKQLGEGGRGELESADEFLLSASRVMSPKPLPAPAPEIVDAEDEEEESEE